MTEKVEVVIKIPKYYLTHPQDYTCLAECVRRGVPLPKHHGRIIDESKINTVFYTTKEIINNNIEHISVEITHTDAPTIIEGE